MDVFNINGCKQLPIFGDENLFLASRGEVDISCVVEHLKEWVGNERTDTCHEEKQLGCLLHVTDVFSISVLVLVGGN